MLYMTMADAIYRNGTFHPTEPVALPEDCHVRLSVETLEPTSQQEQAIGEIYRLMGLRFRSGEHDVAERHKEHQP
jgi:predicted DNA-binding antitoxin AbrB/MazE fold protein